MNKKELAKQVLEEGYFSKAMLETMNITEKMASNIESTKAEMLPVFEELSESDLKDILEWQKSKACKAYGELGKRLTPIYMKFTLNR